MQILYIFKTSMFLTFSDSELIKKISGIETVKLPRKLTTYYDGRVSYELKLIMIRIN